jgi:hypothetical protein
MKYIAEVKFVAQTSPDTWEPVSKMCEVQETTTVKELREWAIKNGSQNQIMIFTVESISK